MFGSWWLLDSFSGRFCLFVCVGACVVFYDVLLRCLVVLRLCWFVLMIVWVCCVVCIGSV